MEPSKQAHLEMIQGVVNRLSHNSFLLKGWSVILVSGMFALAAKDDDLLFVYLANFPALAFWLLDGFFLKQERLFRKLYDHVRKLPEEKVDFSMDVSTVSAEVASWASVSLSITMIAFHGVIIMTIIAVIVFSLLAKLP